MGDFELIQTNFCNADETINFGTRTIATESLYEISTLICLKSEDELFTGISDVTIKAIMKNGYLYFSNGKFLKIFGGPELAELIFHASLGSNIICMAVYPDQELLAVCLETGVIKLFRNNGNGEFTTIFSKCLYEGAIPQNISAYELLEDFDGCVATFLVIFEDGTIFTISVKDENAEENQLFNLNYKINISSCLHPLLISTGSCCSVLNTETRELIKLDLPFQVKKMYPLGSKFLYLDFEGKLRKLCSLTMKSFLIDYDYLLEDILVLHDGTKILTVTKPNELGDFFLQLLETDFKQVFSLKMKNPVHLVDINSTTDDILFVSLIKNQNAKIQELQLKMVYEAEPETRFYRLIKRQRFEEAEAFAKTFNIDPSIVLKAKAECIVDKVKCNSEEINSLINLMDSIQESYFNLQCCMNVECSSFDDVKKILKYASKISPSSSDERKEKKKLMDLFFRYETFIFLSKNDDDILQSWIRFAVCDLLEEVKDCLKNFQIDDAIRIYSRMDEETVKSLNKEFVIDVLDVLKQLPLDLYQSFLPTFFPITMTHLPYAMPLFVNWLQDKILSMEKNDALNFPESGVKMVEEVLELIRMEKQNGMSLQAQCMLNRKGLEDLSNLFKGLNALQKLKKDYAIIVELSKYLEGPEKFISTLLRLSLPPELYDDFLKNFVQIYMLQNNIDHDIIFAEEIRNLLKFDGSWMSIIEMILKNISSLDINLQITQELLLNSPVPWCDEVRRIAHRSLQFSHPMVETISKILNDEARYNVIRNRPYLMNGRKIYSEFTSSDIKRIIYFNEPEMIEDIFHMCRTDDEHIEAISILANHFVRNGDFNQVLSVLDRIKPEAIDSLEEEFLNAEYILQQKYFDTATKEKYYKYIQILFKRLKNSNCIDMENLEKRFRLIEGYQDFGINFTSTELKSPMDFVRDINLAALDFPEILQYAEKIASSLSKDTDEVLLQLCDSIKKFDVLIKAGEYLYKKDASAKNLCMSTTLFLKYLGYQDFSQFNTTIFEKIHDQTLPSINNLNSLEEMSENDQFSRGLKLGEKLITKAMAKDGSDLQILEIYRWIDSCFYLTRPESTLHDELFPNVYLPKQVVPSSSVLHTIQGCFQNVVSCIDGQKAFSSECNSLVPLNMKLKEEPLTEESIRTISFEIDVLCKEGSPITAYSLLETVTNSISLHQIADVEILKPLKIQLRDKCLPQLMKAVISAEHIDLEFLYNLLLLTQKDYIKFLFYFLRIYKRNCTKLNDLSRIGIKLLDHFKDTEGREAMVDSVKSCKWWNRLAPVHSKIDYTEFFKSTPDARLKSILHLHVLELHDINSYCKDFNLDVDEYYREYLKSTLFNFTPQYNIQKELDKRVLVVENNENALYKKCQEIISLIKDKPRTLVELQKMLKEVNFYNYEVFLTIYEIFEKNAETKYDLDRKMVLFLKEYTRHGNPSQREKEAWIIMFPDAQILDPLSEFRFPFIPLLFTSEIWNILRPEVNLNSYKLWFNATLILKNLKVDDICVYAVKHVVSSGILGNYLPNDWKLYSELGDLLHNVNECVQHITNLESATSVVYELMNHIPNGADKVKAAELSLKYAIKYREQNMNNPEVEKTFVKLKNNFYSLSVRHILRRYNLYKEHYLKLVTQPEILIENLYMDERVSKQVVRLDYSDVNDVVDAISELFGLEVQTIRLNLLTRLLNNTNDFDNVHLMSSFNNASFNYTDDDDCNLKRAIYICTSGNRQYWETYLLNVFLSKEEGFGVSDSRIAVKANAAKCFCAITDEERISELTNQSYEEFLKYVDKLALLSDLASLGIMLNVETLNEFSKRELLKKLSHMGKPLAIKCMGAVCISYFLEEHKYWEYIINSSIKLGMISELKTYVDFLKHKCDKQFYINAWQVILDKTFEEITHESEDDLEKTLVNNFLMLQSCPVAFSLNVEKMLDICIKINKREYAALLLHYMPEEKRTNMEKKIFCSEIDWSRLKNKGLWGVHNLSKWYNLESA